MTIPTVGVLLAGGLARRMGGGDKSLLSLGGERILDKVIARARPQVDHLILNANGDPGRFSEFNLPVVPDIIDDFAGPLAGILTGMNWAQMNTPKVEWLVSFATDTPFLPKDMVKRFMATMFQNQADIVFAVSKNQVHPVFGLWPLRLKDELKAAMINEKMRKIDLWTARYRTAHADFDYGDDGFDPFFNVNRPENLHQAKQLLEQQVS